MNFSLAFFDRQLQRHFSALQVLPSEKVNVECAADLSATLDIREELGWLQIQQFRLFRAALDHTENDAAYQLSESEIGDIDLLKPLRRGRLLPGITSRLLIALRDVQDQAMLQGHSGLESLLRHVEVKRSACCQSVCETQTTVERYLDRHRLTLAFLMVTRVSRDWRFLNAALKLNEWPAASHARMRPGRCTSKWLHALALQELVVQEMLA